MQTSPTRRLPRLLAAFWHRPRLSGAIVLGIALFAALAPDMGGPKGVLMAFDIAALIYLTSIAWMMATSRPQVLLRRAEHQVEGRWIVLTFSLLMSSVVLVALHTVLHLGPHAARPDLLLAALSVVLSWLFFGIVFAQAYAHADQLARRAGTPALIYPGSQAPDYWDYVYFSLILSMTFQTSDVSIADPRMRRMALMQSVVAFFFNVFIIAQTVNAVGGAF